MKKRLLILTLVTAVLMVVIPTSALATSELGDTTVNLQELSVGKTFTKEIPVVNDSSADSVTVSITNNGPGNKTRTAGDYVHYGNWYTASSTVSNKGIIAGTVKQRVFIGYDLAKGGCYFGTIEPLKITYLRPGWSPYAVTSERTSPWRGLRLRTYFNNNSGNVLGHYVDFHINPTTDPEAYIIMNIDVLGPMYP